MDSKVLDWAREHYPARVTLMESATGKRRKNVEAELDAAYEKIRRKELATPEPVADNPGLAIELQVMELVKNMLVSDYVDQPTETAVTTDRGMIVVVEQRVSDTVNGCPTITRRELDRVGEAGDIVLMAKVLMIKRAFAGCYVLSARKEEKDDGRSV